MGIFVGSAMGLQQWASFTALELLSSSAHGAQRNILADPVREKNDPFMIIGPAF